MYPDRLSFPSIPGEPSAPARPSGPGAGETPFAAIYSEAVEAANQELSAIVSADSPDSDSTSPVEDPIGFLELRAASAPGANPLAGMAEDFEGTHGELMQHIAAIRQGQRAVAGYEAIGESSSPAARDTVPASLSVQPTENGFTAGVHRLISWLDSHAHLHSTHRCAASVRQAMEAAGIPTEDRPASGDAGDYGPFLLRHGAQVVAMQSYEPKAGDIAVFDRTDDHPAGHIQVFDGQHWVSDFLQHTFSPYRDQASTPAVTVYRLS